MKRWGPKNRIQNRSKHISKWPRIPLCVTVSPAKTSPNPNRPWQSFPTLGGQMDKAWLSFSSASQPKLEGWRSFRDPWFLFDTSKESKWWVQLQILGFQWIQLNSTHMCCEFNHLTYTKLQSLHKNEGLTGWPTWTSLPPRSCRPSPGAFPKESTCPSAQRCI
jgi:hypothetical protein